MNFTPKKTSEMVFSNNTSRTTIHGILDGELPFPKNGISGLLFYGVYGSGKTTYADIFCNELEIIRGRQQGTANVHSIDCGKVTNFSKLTKLCLLLKGPTTFISQNSELIINTAPNGGMSKPGMGDVLTGLIGGLASLPKIKVKDAAIIGTYVHSNAGMLARKSKGSTSMTASDVISFIPQVFKNLEE